MKIILGLVIMLVGCFFVIKSEWMLQAFGRLDFFEKHFQLNGGSRFGYKISGLIAIFIGILIMTGLINGFMLWLLSPILKYQI